MNIAISGSTGLVGSALSFFFKQQGYTVYRIIRSENQLQNQNLTIQYDSNSGYIDLDKLEGMDAVINLSGANISGKRWTPYYKNFLRDSRLKSTQILVNAFTQLKNPPKIFLSASAVGYYGNTNVVMEESAPQGDGFLAQLAHDWEKTANQAKGLGIRTVFMRFGIILSPVSGALAKMLPIFKFGLGGKIAHGKQKMSWISIEEIPFIVQHLLFSNIEGAVNIVSPNAVTNEEFSCILGKILRKPAFFPVPGVMLKLIYGSEFAQELLLNGCNVYPQKLLDSGYCFQISDLESCLERLL